MKLRRQPTKISPPGPELLPAVIESLLFVASEPQDIATLAKSLNVTRQKIEQALDYLTESTNGRGVFVQRIGDRVQLATVPDAAPYIEQFLEVEYGQLSRAALETLAIIAYRSPVTRAVVESVRGVNSDHAVATLLARGLIEEVGRAPGPGPARAVRAGSALPGVLRPPDARTTCPRSRRWRKRTPSSRRPPSTPWRR